MSHDDLSILTLDPGGTTGWLFAIGTQPFTTGEIGPEEHHVELAKFLQYTNNVAKYNGTEFVVICEPFEYRKSDEEREKIEYISAEYVGVTKYYCRFNNVTYIEQQASTVKQFFTDEVLKDLGVWVPGSRHRRDAIRHYFYYRTFTLNDKTLLYKLKGK